MLRIIFGSIGDPAEKNICDALLLEFILFRNSEIIFVGSVYYSFGDYFPNGKHRVISEFVHEGSSHLGVLSLLFQF